MYLGAIDWVYYSRNLSIYLKIKIEYMYPIIIGVRNEYTEFVIWLQYEVYIYLYTDLHFLDYIPDQIKASHNK